MNKKNIKLDLFLKIFLALILLFSLLKVALDQGMEKNEKAVVLVGDFAKCLATKDIKMYGIDSCPFCTQQKKMFGSAFTQLKYVNCEFSKEECEQENIEHYPVWKYDNKKISGILSFEDLAKLSSCPLPTEN